MNNITEITKRDIIDLFKKGYVESTWLGDTKVFYPYEGRLTEIEFLEKLYPLDKMTPKYDSRCQNAAEEIGHHTVVNANDWESDWIFDDDRFGLQKGSDIVLLNFLCAVFHPENRMEDGYWNEYFKKINALIYVDGYELYESEKISGRAVYEWRKLTPEEIASGRFLPFSLRHKNELKDRIITIPTIPQNIRTELLNLFNKYDDTLYRTDDTNCNYTISAKDAIIADMEEYYTPKAYLPPNGKYSETSDLNLFIIHNRQACVFDAIEIFARNAPDSFVSELNLLFRNAGLSHQLLGGKIEIAQLNFQTEVIIREVGLKELRDQSLTLYKSNNASDKQIAVEKLWDAFERLKTYYGGNKKTSVNEIISKMANGDDDYFNLLNDEFNKLTTIGNNYRIRHHEKGKIEIADTNYYTYFFQRCFALVDLALKYLK
ncbi:MAG: hypothetical protein LBV72_09045 [Tannerella sp.]|jgi:hypothetical protein|nr:hypothetical protein [Tannerella sp.]